MEINVVRMEGSQENCMIKKLAAMRIEEASGCLDKMSKWRGDGFLENGDLIFFLFPCLVFPAHFYCFSAFPTFSFCFSCYCLRFLVSLRFYWKVEVRCVHLKLTILHNQQCSEVLFVVLVVAAVLEVNLIFLAVCW